MDRVGTFGYALDDPYIHLSIAETINSGSYGINVGEYTSPSSSIIFPLLVAAGLAIGLDTWTPLVLNVIPAVIIAAIFGMLLARALPDGRGGTSGWTWLLLPFVLVSTNAFALPYAGMEHTLHVLASLAIVVGLARMHPAEALPAYLIVGVLAAPLLRFEGLAMSGAALIAIGVSVHWRSAVALGLALVLMLGAYAAIMSGLGLPPLPSSVLVKSGPSAAAVEGGSNLFGEVLQSFRETLQSARGRPVFAGAILLLIASMVPRLGVPVRRVAAVVGIAALAHCVAGKWNGFHRYQIYLVASEMAALLLILGRIASPRIWPVLAVAAACLPTLKSYALTALSVPMAAENIHDQQYQMHRFATEFYPHAVAVNDLGWVSFRNDAYVLDLWGLGSEEMRRLTASGNRGPDTIRELARRYDTRFAMVFTGWFDGDLPPQWCHIATLTTIRITTPYADVDFYLAEPTHEAEMRDALEAFRPTLPERVSFAVHDCPA
ncbi:hypothetical protein ATO6_06770 [Oceanicola sp. 22II-s10i]|nr:hypothetical protein ATO6_06770 [Oceanicola sp. 22II-s10i]